MTRRTKLKFNEAAERRAIESMGYTFEQLVSWAERHEAMAQGYRSLADAELRYREFLTGRGEKWKATYSARRAIERAEKAEARARIFREFAERTPTCELPGVSQVGA